MNNRVSASSSSETIRALRENGQEPIFTVDEHKTLDEIMNEIDWSIFTETPDDASIFETIKEPVYHLDGEPADQLLLPTRRARTINDELVMAE